MNVPPAIMKRIERTLADLAGFAGDLDGVTVSEETWHALQASARDARDILTRLPRRGPKKALPGESIKAKRTRKTDAYAEKRAKVRRQIEPRADGMCECCFAVMANPAELQMDEFRGGSGNRQKLTNEVNCWLLCDSCHRDKTNNKPSRAYWIGEYVGHLEVNDLPVPPELR